MYIQSFLPTMVADNGVLHVVANKDTFLTVKVLDIKGKISKTIKASIVSGSQQVLLQMDDLLSGNYVLNAFSGDVFLRSIRFSKH